STEFVPDTVDLGVRFYLTASGSQSQAQTSFTDGNPVSSSPVITPNPANVPPTVTATITEGGSPKTNISAAEYFIDPSGGACPADTVRGTAMTATGTFAFTTSQTQDVTATISAAFPALTEGSHTVHVRGKDATVW